MCRKIKQMRARSGGSSFFTSGRKAGLTVGRLIVLCCCVRNSLPASSCITAISPGGSHQKTHASCILALFSFLFMSQLDTLISFKEKVVRNTNFAFIMHTLMKRNVYKRVKQHYVVFLPQNYSCTVHQTGLVQDYIPFGCLPGTLLQGRSCLGLCSATLLFFQYFSLVPLPFQTYGNQ